MDLAHHTERTVIFQTRALRGSGKIIGLPREVGLVSTAASRDIREIIQVVERHDNLLHERKRAALVDIHLSRRIPPRDKEH